MHSKSKHELWQEVVRGLYEKADNKHRRLIQAAAEDGIEWRGEYMAHFLCVIEEVTLRREMNFEDYRREAVRWMKTLALGRKLPYDKCKRLAG